MPGRLKPVGRTPICTPSRLRRIDPIWVFGPVPQRYWSDPEHRLDYMLWLGHKLRFRWMEDYYRLSHEDIKRHRGAGLATRYWNASAVEGVKQCFPDYQWHDWLFLCAPRAFWHNPENHRRYMRWLGEQLGFRRPEDWYRVTIQDFLDHCGGSFLGFYKNALSSAVKAYLPDYDWKEWMFYPTPGGFWDVRENRLRYMRWLGEKLGCSGPEDWYGVLQGDFEANYGNGCMKRYGCCPTTAVMDLFPDYPWLEWRFARVPAGFWDQPENRRRYIEWLGKKLGFRRTEDWLRVRRRDFKENYGGGLLAMYPSCLDVVRSCLPRPQRKSLPARRRRKRAMPIPERLLAGRSVNGEKVLQTRLTVEQILAWADAYHKRTGRWPRYSDEPVERNNHITWSAVDRALRLGIRGLRGGSSLPRLLDERRGVRNHSNLPLLSIPKILAWADAHHRRTGRWPSAKIGLVHGGNGDTWLAVNSALRDGRRGLPGGYSLAKLLAERRGVRIPRHFPPLSLDRILKWAKKHRRATGEWPTKRSGLIPGTDGDTWSMIDRALHTGRRGLPRGLSLAQLREGPLPAG
jgi:hypothetical protein